jgi:extracellular elastinolytic metalloproteinase
MSDNWYESAVTATAPHKIISVVDWASDASAAPIPVPDTPEIVASYNVFGWGINDPVEGNRTSCKEKQDTLASPAGWHAIPYSHDPSLAGVRVNTKDFYRNSTTTWGNNVFAQENWEGQNRYIDNYRPDAGKDRVFDYPYKPKETDRGDAQQEAHKHINATVAQLFYTANMVHDLYYRYATVPVRLDFPAHCHIATAGTKSQETSSNTTLDAAVRRTTPSSAMLRTVRATTMPTS